MGVTLTQDHYFLDLSISSESGSVRQAQNIYKMLKASKKTVIASMTINSSKNIS